MVVWAVSGFAQGISPYAKKNRKPTSISVTPWADLFKPGALAPWSFGISPNAASYLGNCGRPFTMGEQNVSYCETLLSYEPEQQPHTKTISLYFVNDRLLAQEVEFRTDIPWDLFKKLESMLKMMGKWARTPTLTVRFDVSIDEKQYPWQEDLVIENIIPWIKQKKYEKVSIFSPDGSLQIKVEVLFGKITVIHQALAVLSPSEVRSDRFGPWARGDSIESARNRSICIKSSSWRRNDEYAKLVGSKKVELLQCEVAFAMPVQRTMPKTVELVFYEGFLQRVELPIEPLSSLWYQVYGSIPTGFFLHPFTVDQILAQTGNPNFLIGRSFREMLTLTACEGSGDDSLTCLVWIENPHFGNHFTPVFVRLEFEAGYLYLVSIDIDVMTGTEQQQENRLAPFFQKYTHFLRQYGPAQIIYESEDFLERKFHEIRSDQIEWKGILAKARKRRLKLSTRPDVEAPQLVRSVKVGTYGEKRLYIQLSIQQGSKKSQKKSPAIESVSLPLGQLGAWQLGVTERETLSKEHCSYLESIAICDTTSLQQRKEEAFLYFYKDVLQRMTLPVGEYGNERDLRDELPKVVAFLQHALPEAEWWVTDGIGNPWRMALGGAEGIVQALKKQLSVTQSQRRYSIWIVPQRRVLALSGKAFIGLHIMHYGFSSHNKLKLSLEMDVVPPDSWYSLDPFSREDRFRKWASSPAAYQEITTDASCKRDNGMTGFFQLPLPDAEIYRCEKAFFYENRWLPAKMYFSRRRLYQVEVSLHSEYYYGYDGIREGVMNGLQLLKKQAPRHAFVLKKFDKNQEVLFVEKSLTVQDVMDHLPISPWWYTKATVEMKGVPDVSVVIDTGGSQIATVVFQQRFAH